MDDLKNIREYRPDALITQYEEEFQRLSDENSDIKRRFDRQVQITKDYIAETSRIHLLLEQAVREGEPAVQDFALNALFSLWSESE